jgi:hypothetical protein
VLLCTSLAVNQVIVLVLEQLVSVAAFAEFLIDEPILSSEGLDILCKFRDFLSLELG